MSNFEFSLRCLSIKAALYIAFILSIGLILPINQARASDWWNISDAEFAQKYADKAVSQSSTDQSTVAWMLFARLNQPQKLGNITFTKWELWPSNEDTFSPAVRAFVAANKIRTRPHLQSPKLFRLPAHPELLHSKFPSAGEEVTRNQLSYDYIMKRGLNTKAGVWNLLSSANPKVDFPIGAIEIKADWYEGAIEGAYQITDPTNQTTYSLKGLHIMAKVKPSPKDPFHSEDPSWFWTTFEFKNNDGLAHAQSLVTYKDALSQDQANALLSQAGLGNTAFVNYRSNGTQIRYSDKQNATIILGNTTMEAFAGVPSNTPPSKWTQWNSSCHTCHGEASGNPETKKFFPFNVWIGKITDPSINAFTSLDFVWSIPFQAR